MNERRFTHEDFDRPEDTGPGSERAFGFVFAGFCALVAAYQLWQGRPTFWGWLAAGALFAAAAIFLPVALRPLNRAWHGFGLVLHRIVSPVILGLMFFAVFLPIGLLMRIAGKRPLRLAFDRGAQSYWIRRDGAELGRDSFRNQF